MNWPLVTSVPCTFGQAVAPVRFAGRLSWALTFSFAHAIQQPALDIRHGHYRPERLVIVQLINVNRFEAGDTGGLKRDTSPELVWFSEVYPDGSPKKAVQPGK